MVVAFFSLQCNSGKEEVFCHLLCFPFKSQMHSVKYVATFMSVLKSYEFPETLKHNKQQAIARMCECAFSGFAESFYCNSSSSEKTQRIWFSMEE